MDLQKELMDLRRFENELYKKQKSIYPQITVRMSATLMAELDAYASIHQTTRGQIIKRALQRFLNIKKYCGED